MNNSHDRNRSNMQIKRDTKKVLQILLPNLPSQLIDLTCNTICHEKEKSTKKHIHNHNLYPRIHEKREKNQFILKRVDSCDGLIDLNSNKNSKNNIKRQMDFHFT